MCGIAGYIQLHGNPPDNLNAILINMQKKLVHRGPDGHGVWVSENHRIGLAHTRLSIIDTSANGAQPMFNSNKNVVVSFNGEIYNFLSLKKTLTDLGHPFTSSSDTEVLLAAYDQWGIQCLEYLEGMFAIIFVDLKTDEVFIVRDRIGVKPLYFATDHYNFLACASEINALWQISHVTKQPYLQGISEFLEFLQPLAPNTVYKNIYSLPAAHYIHINRNKQISYHTWYDVLLHSQKITCPDENDSDGWIEIVDQTLQKSIQKRMVADVDLGVFLSGGLDSSLIAAIMSNYQSPVKTFTLHIEGNDIDERQWAREVSNTISSNHYEYFATKEEYNKTLNSIANHSDQPIGDPLCAGLSILSEYIKKQGISVALFGEGADELFAGYHSYQRYKQLYPWLNIGSKLPTSLKKIIRSTLYPISKKRPLLHNVMKLWSNNEYFFKTSALGVYHPARLLKHEEQASPLNFLTTDFQGEYRKLEHMLSGKDCLTHIAYGELLHRIPQLLLTRFDHMTMRAALEGRVPYLDHHLVALSLRIPESLKIRDNEQKWLLKKVAEKHLPKNIIYRKKTGFTAPLSTLMKQQQINLQFQNLLNSRAHSLSEVFDLKEVKSWTNLSQPDLSTWLMYQVCSLDMFI